MPTVITGARLLDPAHDIDKVADVLVVDGRVAAVGTNLNFNGVEVIQGDGKVLVPGFVDLHVHLREPGRTHKETIQTGCRAAAAGGFTAVCAMPNTFPPVDSVALVQQARELAKKAAVRCYPLAAVTLAQKGATLSPHRELREAGAVALSDDGEPVTNTRLFYEALHNTRDHGLAIVAHCEDKALSAGGAMHAGKRAEALGLPGIPAAAEEAMVARDIALARATGGKLHIAHVSTKGAMLLIQQAKDSGLDITCEVTPHHLVLTDRDVDAADANTKMNPPLRAWEDVLALRAAVSEGYIDCIATDHAPHHKDEKALPYAEAPFGIAGLETALPLLLTELVDKGVLGLSELVALLSTRPARIFGLPVGALVVGGTADFTLIDPKLTRTVEPDTFYSLGRNTPFGGRCLTGWPVMTMVAGQVVMKDGVVHD
ncbi:MAG: dihydroorotase [Selenomonadales bacterium]|nr:dihydroorotase [Selenomonadales bacterium]